MVCLPLGLALHGFPVISEMQVDLAFFDGEELLCRGSIICTQVSSTDTVLGTSGHVFEVTSNFEEPACPVSVRCLLNGELQYNSELRMGVHDSADWEVVNLGNIHELGFYCKLVPRRAM